MLGFMSDFCILYPSESSISFNIVQYGRRYEHCDKSHTKPVFYEMLNVSMLMYILLNFIILLIKQISYSSKCNECVIQVDQITSSPLQKNTLYPGPQTHVLMISVSVLSSSQLYLGSLHRLLGVGAHSSAH